jgi:hypothetical protein
MKRNAAPVFLALFCTAFCCSTSIGGASGRSLSIQDAIHDADRLEKTPQGRAYLDDARQTLGPAIANAIGVCAPGPKSNSSSELVFVIAADGRVQNVLFTRTTVAACLAKAITGLRLPRPPRDQWLIHLPIVVGIPHK